MTLTFIHSPELDISPFLLVLTKVGSDMGMKIVHGKGESADLHFISSNDSNSYRTGLKVAVGAGWTPERKAKEQIHISLTEDNFDRSHAEIILSWMIDRQEFRKVRPLSHELGNLVMILLGRIMRMKDEVKVEHLESLDILHKRMTTLCEKLDALNIPRYDSNGSEN